jgi:SHS2 domain-containing protein
MKWLLALLLIAVVAAVPQSFDTECKPDQWGLAVSIPGEKLKVKMVAPRAEWSAGVYTVMGVPPTYSDTIAVR